jgi:hypothetical protein
MGVFVFLGLLLVRLIPGMSFFTISSRTDFQDLCITSFDLLRGHVSLTFFLSLMRDSTLTTKKVLVSESAKTRRSDQDNSMRDVSSSKTRVVRVGCVVCD